VNGRFEPGKAMSGPGQNAKNSNRAYLVRSCSRKQTLERTCWLVAFVPEAVLSLTTRVRMQIQSRSATAATNDSWDVAISR
jgi:hypothetical protein